jgi:UDP:flavonoid glycosyltransferase YjiC (YdhE family)
MIYASMGTLQNRVREIFETLAKACAGLDAQLVLSLGSRDQAPDAAFAGAPAWGRLRHKSSCSSAPR